MPEPTLSPSVVRAAAEVFRNEGVAVIPGFATRDEVARMKSTMKSMVLEWWEEEARTAANAAEVFVTDTKGQTKAQATSRYFFESADRVHFFREAANATSEWGVPALNKVGHGLHLDNATVFGQYAKSPRIAAVARHVAGLRAPVLPQSMYIFKEGRVGGSVTSHQDGTFLYTRPRQTVVGLWLALHDAHEGNGCLWARPGSHREPLRRRFVRGEGDDGEVAMAFSEIDADAKAMRAEATLSPALLGERVASLRGAAAMAKRALGVERGARRTRVRRSEEAREWEGYYPPANLTETTAADRALLAAKGFVPLPVSAGDLVVFPGTLDHLSFPNGSPHARHTFRTSRPRSTIAPNPTLLAPGTHVSKPPHTRAGKPAHPRLC